MWRAPTPFKRKAIQTDGFNVELLLLFLLTARACMSDMASVLQFYSKCTTTASAGSLMIVVEVMPLSRDWIKMMRMLRVRARSSPFVSTNSELRSWSRTCRHAITIASAQDASRSDGYQDRPPSLCAELLKAYPFAKWAPRSEVVLGGHI